MAIGDKSSSVRNWIDRFVSSVIIKAHGAVRDRQWILFGVGLFEGQGKARADKRIPASRGEHKPLARWFILNLTSSGST